MEIRGDVKRLNGCRVEMVDLYNINSPYNVWDKFTIKEAFDDYFDVEDNDSIAPRWKTAKLILDEKFLEKFKTEDIAINCETEEEAIEFCNWMHDKGLKWNWNYGSYKDITEYGKHKENTCYTGRGTFKNITYFTETIPHTIIKFKDCIISESMTKTKGDDMKDYMQTEDFKEFVKYWKENDVAVEFDDRKDQLLFYSKIRSEPYYGNLVYPFTSYHKEFKDAISFKKDYTFKDRYTIIKYKDLKNWMEILGCTKVQQVDKKQYKLKDKTITLKDILDRDPCTSEYDKFIDELVEEGYSFKEICKGSIKFNIEHLLEYETVQNNIDWFVKEGLFIEEKKFEPFTFNIEINTKEELISLLKHLNLGRDTVEHENDPEWDYDGDKYSGEFICNTWKRLDDIYDEVVE